MTREEFIEKYGVTPEEVIAAQEQGKSINSKKAVPKVSKSKSSSSKSSSSKSTVQNKPVEQNLSPEDKLKALWVDPNKDKDWYANKWIGLSPRVVLNDDGSKDIIYQFDKLTNCEVEYVFVQKKDMTLDECIKLNWKPASNTIHQGEPGSWYLLLKITDTNGKWGMFTGPAIIVNKLSETKSDMKVASTEENISSQSIGPVSEPNRVVKVKEQALNGTTTQQNIQKEQTKKKLIVVKLWEVVSRFFANVFGRVTELVYTR